MPNPGLKLFDDALPAPLFRRLRTAVARLGTEKIRRTYQTTFWFDLRDPVCLPEDAAQLLLSRLPSRSACTASITFGNDLRCVPS